MSADAAMECPCCHKSDGIVTDWNMRQPPDDDECHCDDCGCTWDQSERLSIAAADSAEARDAGRWRNLHITLEVFGHQQTVKIGFCDGRPAVTVIETNGDLVGHCVHPAGIQSAISAQAAAGEGKL